MYLVTLLMVFIALYYLIALFKIIFKKIQVLNATKKIPGPPSINFLFGNIKTFYGPPDEVFQVHVEYGKKYWPIYKTWATLECAVNIMTPENFELILTDNQHNSKSTLYNILNNWLAKGLLTSNGQKWHERRHLLTPAFHFTILQQFCTIFNEETDNLVKSLKENTGKPLEITKYISLFTLKTIGQTSMGSSIETTGLGNAYRQAIEQIGGILIYRFMRPWLWFNSCYIFTRCFYKEMNLLKILHRFTDHVIKEREKQFNFSNLKGKRMAMLDLLLKIKNTEHLIDDKGIREEVDTFMFEGHDTTSSAIAFCLMLIACHKDVQDALVEEIHQVLDDNRKPTYQDLQELKYMERTIKESLRIYPSVYFVSRVLGADMTTHEGYFLHKGTIIVLQIHTMHHNPDIYPDPEKFDPDRFLPENCEKRHRFAYMPFSAGARNCIGQKFAILEMKTVLCGILRNFVIEPVDNPETITLMADIVLRTKNGIKVKLTPRNN